MMIKKNLLSLFSLFVSMTLLVGATMHYNTPEYEKLANQITAETAVKIRKKHHLDPIGSGGSMMNDIKVMALSFNCHHSLTIEESRNLIVNCVGIYLDSINENSQIRPYLSKHPFMPEDIKIEIFFYKEGFKDVATGKLSCVAAGQGEVSYFIDKSEYALKKFHKEPYEEALRIVREQGQLEMSE